MLVRIQSDIKPKYERDKILRLLFMREQQGATIRDIAQALGWGKTKTAEVCSKCRAAGLTFEDAEKMTAEELGFVLEGKPKTRVGMIRVPEQYWEWVCRELNSGKPRKTLNYIWTEFYSKDHPDGLGYSQFCRRYHEWFKAARVEIILPQEKVPGREIFIDWVGDTVSLLDSETASPRRVYFFIATIGDSSYPFVEAFLTMDQKNWCQAHIDMLEHYGGVPRLFVPDNTKTAVSAASLYDPTLNHAYLELAHHYGVGISPARVRAPKDKPTVEAGVKWLEGWLLTWLQDSGTIYRDISEINRDVRKRMKELADRPFKARAGTRKSVFEAIDKPALRALPGDPFLFFETVTRKSLPANWHFDVKDGKDTFYYSFPYQYAKRPGHAHVYPKKIEIYAEGAGRIAFHERRFTGKRYCTDISHAPKNQQERMKFNMRTGKYYRTKAGRIGKSVYEVVDRILTSGPVEEQGYRSCDGLLRMSEDYGDHALEEACRRALEVGRPNYSGVKSFLSKGNSARAAEVVPPSDSDHENLRKEGWR